jgi:predicted nucleic acid-binding protein
MSLIFVDTSGFYAALDASDPNHAEAVTLFREADRGEWHLLSHNYVIQETWALLQARLGWPAVDAWLRLLVPRCEIVWVNEGLHALGAARCRQAKQRRLSLTDCVSLELMSRENIREALANDEHLAAEGIVAPKIPG